MKALKLALLKTIEKRNSSEYFSEYEKILRNIINYERIHYLWNSYAKKNIYANNINFDDIINNLIAFMKDIAIVEEVTV